MVSVTFNHRPVRVPHVLVQPLFAQHGDECGEQGGQETRIHETGGSDDLVLWIFLSRRNGGGFTGDIRLIESMEDGAEDYGLLVRIGLEVGTDVDGKGGVGGREQICLQEQVR